MKRITPPIVRFELSYEVLDDGCWQWLKYKNKGYGRFNNGTKVVDAHRWYYMQTVNKELTTDMHLDHLCRNRACVNPKHLEVVTNLINWERGQSITRKKSLQTHCIHGHKFTKDNTYYRGSKRRCNRCHAISERNYRAKKRKLLV